MYISMQSKLAGQQGIQYETLATILKPFSVLGNGLQKIRAKLVPKDDPNVLNLEHLTGEQILTTDGLQFLQYDNQVLNNRILIFFSERALRMISTCSVWYGDGTFKAGKF